MIFPSEFKCRIRSALAFHHHASIIHRVVFILIIILNRDYRTLGFGNGVGPAEFTPKSDVYGFGVILLELITGKKPVGDDYPDDDNLKATGLVDWVRGLVRVNRGSRAIDPKIRAVGEEAQMVEGLKIGYLCTAEVPAKRPSMQQVVGLLKDIESK